jgi:hypothetical protein
MGQNCLLFKYYEAYIRDQQNIGACGGEPLDDLATSCSSPQTVAPKPANKSSVRLTFGANKRKVGLTLTANEPALNANSLLNPHSLSRASRLS